MNKNRSKYDDEIDMTEIIKTFWDDKVKILLIIFVSILIGISFSNRNQVSYQGFLEIKESRNSEFNVFYSINRFLTEYDFDSFPVKSSDSELNKNIEYRLDSKTSLEEFIKLFLKYERLISVLEKIPSINMEISKLSKSNQQTILFDYAQLFTIEKNDQNYILNFKWHDSKEAKEILNQTLNLVKKDYTKIVLDDLERLTEIKKNYIIQRSLTRIEYLKEQAQIATELGIIDNHVIGTSDDKKKIFNLYPSGGINYNNNIDYYLRGSKAINKEINMFRNRKYGEFSQIFNEINNLRNKTEIKWVDYNLFLLKIKPIKNSNNILKISIILGTVLAFFYSIISATLKNKKRIN